MEAGGSLVSGGGVTRGRVLRIGARRLRAERDGGVVAGDVQQVGLWGGAAGSGPVQDALERARRVRRLEVVGPVGSTQDVARARATDGAPDGTLVVTEQQTSGRGRVGRAWDDDLRPGASLAATLLLDAGDRSSLLPHTLGVAVVDAVAPWLGDRVRLKWPNDVLVRDDGGPRKVAGLLVELVTAVGPERRTVILAGIGLNVDRRHLGPAPDRAGVADLAGRDVDPSELLAALVRGLDDAVALHAEGSGPLLARYRAVSDTDGRRVRVTLPDGAVVEGRAGIDDEGRLTVGSVLGRHTVLTGTVRDAAGRA